MKEFLCDSVFFGVAISILAYELGVFLKKKLKLAVFNHLSDLDRCRDRFSGCVPYSL